ncbi:hypothetical protein LEP1GSC133_3723 [Leptospira borgpetersenii serovar Pomona str. 200901868]|uniref:Uncharacterized protein n=1 Tax=Leptospira borgpetersenii serovar Pomona str. 200901868 TaxID=1192866 RepID=M6W1Q6_LEPBO|nr:hypothetical protein LEP1GSC133_3723 [Leptospira borgpetersenii serovar Pomona str. 200901868]
MIVLISFQVLGQVLNQFCRFPQNSIKKLSPIIQEPNLRKSYRIPTKLLVPQHHIRVYSKILREIVAIIFDKF